MTFIAKCNRAFFSSSVFRFHFLHETFKLYFFPMNWIARIPKLSVSRKQSLLQDKKPQEPIVGPDSPVIKAPVCYSGGPGIEISVVFLLLIKLQTATTLELERKWRFPTNIPINFWVFSVWTKLYCGYVHNVFGGINSSKKIWRLLLFKLQRMFWKLQKKSFSHPSQSLPDAKFSVVWVYVFNATLWGSGNIFETKLIIVENE